MRRWGQIAEQKPDGWYMDMAKKAYRPDIYVTAAKELIAEGKMKVVGSLGDLPPELMPMVHDRIAACTA